MALRVLGQSKPAAGVPTSIYQVGVGKQAVVNVIICNTDASNSDTFLLYVRPNGFVGMPTTTELIHRGTISPEDSFESFGISLDAGAAIWLTSTNSRLTITITGSES